MANQVHILTFPIQGGTTTGALGTIPLVGSALLFKAPSAKLGGGITILEAELTFRSTGLGTFQLYTATEGTIGLNGTITSAFGTSSIAAGTTYPMTISDGFVDADEWVMLAQTGSALYPGGNIHIAYVMGK